MGKNWRAGRVSVCAAPRLSVLIGNADMHLKNWSLLYPDGWTPVLSPAYDFVSMLSYLPGDTLALSFGGTKSLDAITIDQVRRFTDTARLPMKPVWDVVLETVARTADVWKSLSHKDVLPSDTRKNVDEHIRRITTGTKTS
jgi:serine/threonine-protein kinase HipA